MMAFESAFILLFLPFLCACAVLVTLIFVEERQHKKDRKGR